MDGSRISLASRNKIAIIQIYINSDLCTIVRNNEIFKNVEAWKTCLSDHPERTGLGGDSWRNHIFRTYMP